MYCIVRPMVPENNDPCTYHWLHVLTASSTKNGCESPAYYQYKSDLYQHLSFEGIISRLSKLKMLGANRVFSQRIAPCGNFNFKMLHFRGPSIPFWGVRWRATLRKFRKFCGLFHIILTVQGICYLEQIFAPVRANNYLLWFAPSPFSEQVPQSKFWVLQSAKFAQMLPLDNLVSS